MQVQLFNGDELMAQLDDDDATLDAYHIENEMRLHVVDNFHYLIGNESSTEKFKLTDKQYDERRNTVRDYLKTHHLGKYNEDEMKTIEERKKQEQEEQETKAESINIGDRCVVTRGPRRLGTVRYKGTFHLKPGIFIGVEFDEPLGMNDGSVDGHTYFECKPKYGSMVPIMSVEIGDFPPENDGLDDDEI